MSPIAFLVLAHLKLTKLQNDNIDANWNYKMRYLCFIYYHAANIFIDVRVRCTKSGKICKEKICLRFVGVIGPTLNKFE